MSIRSRVSGTVNHRFLTLTLAGLAVVSIACAAPSPESEIEAEGTALAEDERAAGSAADRAYYEAWLANDTESVMATLTQDAVIVPSGMEPVEGQEAIRAFWFPPDSPPTSVKEYRFDQAEVAGSGDLAYVRGSFALALDYDGESFESEGTYLSLLRRGVDGNWRIARRAWNDHPRD